MSFINIDAETVNKILAKSTNILNELHNMYKYQVGFI